jgi:hypothetical protein
VIVDYLLELLDELRLPRRQRRRILAEVADHLACTAAELHAGGLEPAEAEREAVQRFGAAGELARSFVDQEAARGGNRAARASGLLTLLLAMLVLGPPGRVFDRGAFPEGLVAFVLAQVAIVAGGLTVVRAWRAAPFGGPRGPRLALVLRGAVVVLCCAGGTVAAATVDGLTSGASGWHAGAWLSLAAIGIGVAVTAATVSRSWRRAVAAGTSDPSPSAPAADDVLADIQAVVVLALAQLARRLPRLRRLLTPVAWSVQTLPGELACRAPRLAAWLDLRHHPWRFAVSVASAAGLAFAAGHGLAEGGVSLANLLSGLLGGALIAGVEALAALLGFAVLGRLLGIRTRTTRSRRARTSA